MELKFRYQLQFFADGNGGEKTEEATPKKLSDARKGGQVAKSADLITAVSLLSLFYSIKAFVGYIGDGFLSTYVKVYGRIEKISGEEFTNVTAYQLLQDGLLTILKIILPIILIAVFVAISVNLVQVKWVVSTQPLQPKFSKFNPVSGLKRLFSKDKLLELLKETIKIIAIVYLAYNTLKDKQYILSLLYDLDLTSAIIFIGQIIIDLGIRISVIFVLIGVADYIYQKIKFKKDMRMTKQEVKDEYKQSEGDPQIKGKIRAKMREVSQRRMMQQLPEADVVITNPTHFAAAIKYDKDISDAPILLAKGADYLAMKIKDVARENKIEIVENKPLARMLYYNVEVGNEIPPELYQMTAEVLAYVYSLNKKVK